MEFYEAWDFAEDEQLRENLQRTLKRSRSCSPTSPAGSEEAPDHPAPDAEEDRASATTQSPSVAVEAAEIEEDHAERHGQAEPQFIVVIMGYNLQESLENTINTMGTLLGVHVHPIVPDLRHPGFELL